MESTSPDPLAPKPSTPRRAGQIMASAFGSPKGIASSSTPPQPPPPLGLPPSAAKGDATCLPPLDNGRGAAPVPPLQLSLQPSMTDLVEQQIMLDPNTPRSPNHQRAEQIMTSGSTAQVLKRHMDAVVKVFATHSKPNFALPWQRQQQYTSKSTGFAVKTEEGKRWLLTNAHSVSYNTQVQLKRRGDDEKYPAKVLAIGTECDVALLEVEDEAFWDGIVPLELGGLPALQEAVAVVGYPIGGDSLAVSAGVVSRVQMTHYSHGSMSLLAVQTDAAINSGNSGGPVMNARGQCVGIAFQSLSGSTMQSVGYVIPTSVVGHFLEDVRRNGSYTGFPSLNVVWQEMDSKALKRAYNMQPHQKGVLIRSVAEASNEASVLQPNDVVLRIDGQDVGNDGTVPFRHGERVDFKFLVTNKHVGDTLPLDVLRDGREVPVEVALTHYQYLVPPNLHESKPSYFLEGGLVFTPCSDPYLIQRYGSLGGAPVRLMSKTFYGVKSKSDEEVVVLNSVLACDATIGYESTLGIKDSAVLAFNGTPVFNLAQLARLVMECDESYMRFDLESGNKVVIVDSDVARRCTPEILEEHGIAAQMSKDVREQLEAWQAASATAGGKGADGAATNPANRDCPVVNSEGGTRPGPVTPQKIPHC